MKKKPTTGGTPSGPTNQPMPKARMKIKVK